MSYLNDCRVVGQTTLQGRSWLGWLAHPDVFDVGTSEDDVLVGLIAWSHGAVSRTVLSTIGTN